MDEVASQVEKMVASGKFRPGISDQNKVGSETTSGARLSAGTSA